MAGGGETQRQLLTLIRDFATEKSQGERRVVDLKRRIQQLRHGLDTTHAELQETKRSKELMEQEIKGHQVELSLNESSIHAIESRISLIQDEISMIQSEIQALKNDQNVHRDKFIGHMIDFNKKIREFQKMVARTSHQEKNIEPSSHDGGKVEDKERLKIQAVLRDLEDKLDKLASQKHVEEQEYLEKQINHKKVQEELVDLERQVSLMEAVVEETKDLQKLTNKQTAELEESYADLGDKLQGRCACPSCHLDNMATLGVLLEANQESCNTEH